MLIFRPKDTGPLGSYNAQDPRASMSVLPGSTGFAGIPSSAPSFQFLFRREYSNVIGAQPVYSKTQSVSFDLADGSATGVSEYTYYAGGGGTYGESSPNWIRKVPPLEHSGGFFRLFGGAWVRLIRVN